MSAVTHAFPQAATVGELLSSLLGKDIAVRKCDAHECVGDPKWVCATFVDDDGAIGAVLLCDVATAAFSGAALSLIPVGLAEESTKSGILADNLAENFHEVVNVSASLFNSSGTPRLTLGAFTTPPDEHPADVVAFCTEAGERLDTTVHIDGYGDGKLSLFVA